MFTFAQISDFHISAPDGTANSMYRTRRHLEVAVEHLNNLVPRPEFVLCTGDLVDGGGADQYAVLAGVLKQLQMPFYLIPGNHDDRDGIRRHFPEHGYLMEMAGSDGFIQYTLEDWGPRFIALDTLVPGQTGGRLCQTRLGWLDDRLGDQPDRPTIIFMHHPPFRTGLARMDLKGLEDGAALAEILRRHDNIEAVLAGHLHRYITHRFAGTIAVTAPATAHQIALDLDDPDSLRVIMEPPGGLLHVWFGGDDGLVSHQIYTGGGYGDHLIFANGAYHPKGTPPGPAIAL
ncbi:MAG: phosphodiesterase [Rhodospirillaceae bacterium]|jgi:3',5'-cyclic AMP phosphodiesterase CpdA|nr:phosphodiesterase [Rhodospirillaceae bacterium]MBT4045359.1 phosphodiesterase [Rhodospirillaceae bacterium]MBT4691616.1 phosphodiesterase [Rhodospirillaceae bacterium]MBT5081268.1 phosphodiesterase [Rhodospirillaceae bacterium]MBT5523728.1 phosphodiesterase [Rhodospirillaceae bacterium]